MTWWRTDCVYYTFYLSTVLQFHNSLNHHEMGLNGTQRWTTGDVSQMSILIIIIRRRGWGGRGGHTKPATWLKEISPIIPGIRMCPIDPLLSLTSSLAVVDGGGGEKGKVACELCEIKFNMTRHIAIHPSKYCYVPACPWWWSMRWCIHTPHRRRNATNRPRTHTHRDQMMQPLQLDSQLWAGN